MPSPTVTGFFVDGWVEPGPSGSTGMAGFFLDGWQLPNFFAVASPYVHFTIAVAYPTEGQIFPTGQVNDDDFIVCAIDN